MSESTKGPADASFNEVTSMDAVIEGLKAQEHPDTEHISEYWCEVCDTKVLLTEAEAYHAGWDYPPFIGMWGIVSPRTCPNCTIEKTAYWQILQHVEWAEMTEKHRATIIRIAVDEKKNHPAANG